MATLRVTVTGLLFLQTIQNVMHFQKSDYVTADLATLATEIATNYMDSTMRSTLFSEFIWQNINVMRVDVISDPSYNLSVSLAGTSGSGANAAPSMAVVLRLHTGLIGRHGRGRIYYPCLGPACLSNGILTGPCLTAYTTIGNHILSFWGPSGSSDWNLVVAERNDLSVTHAVTSISPRNTPGHQRRRTVGVGI